VSSATLISTTYRRPSPEEIAALSPNTILHDIHSVVRIRTGPLPGFQDWAASAFAEANGWKYSREYWFSPKWFGKPSNQYDALMDRTWADHALHFRAPRTDGKEGWVNYAIAGQPYHLDGGQ
jgi:hypothetical protein